MRKIIKNTLLFLILVNIVYVFSGAIHYSFTSIDSYSIWLFKSKAFFVEKGFPFKTLSDPNYTYSHPQYPILLPLAISNIYKALGYVNETLVLAIYPFIYLTIILLTYFSLKLIRLTTLQSLLFTYIYSMLSPLLAQGGRMHAGNADIIITLLYWLAFLTVFFFYKTKKEILFLFLILLVGISSQIKQEGLFLFAIILFLPVSKTKKILGILLSLIPTLVWWSFVKQHSIPQSFGLTFYPLPTLFIRALILIKTVLKELMNIKNWYIFWPIFWLLIYLEKERDPFFKKVITPFLFIFIILISNIYLFSTLDISNYAGSSFDRILLQISPFFYPLFARRCLNFINEHF